MNKEIKFGFVVLNKDSLLTDRPFFIYKNKKRAVLRAKLRESKVFSITLKEVK